MISQPAQVFIHVLCCECQNEEMPFLYRYSVWAGAIQAAFAFTDRIEHLEMDDIPPQNASNIPQNGGSMSKRKSAWSMINQMSNERSRIKPPMRRCGSNTDASQTSTASQKTGCSRVKFVFTKVSFI